MNFDSSNNLSFSEKIAELQRNLKQIEIEYGKSSKLPDNLKKTRRLELISQVFDLVPTLANSYSKEEFLRKYGSHSSEIAKATVNEFISQEVPKISTDYSKFFQTQKVLVPSDKVKKVKIKSGDNTGELDDYIEIPEFEQVEIETLTDKSGLIASIETNLKQEMYSLLDNHLEQIQTQNNDGSISKQTLDSLKSEIYETLHGVFSNMKRTKVQTKNKELTFDLANTIEKYSQWNHYKQLTQKILKDFQKANGIVPKTKEIDREYTVATPDGRQLKKTERKVVQILTVDPSVSSDFTRTLFNNDIEDTEGNKVNLYEIWEKKLGSVLGDAMLRYINENPELSAENDAKYFDLFKNVVNQTSLEFCKEYSVSPESMGAVIPEKPQRQRSPLERVEKFIDERSQKIISQQLQSSTQNNPPLITSQSFQTNNLNSQEASNNQMTNQPQETSYDEAILQLAKKQLGLET